MTKLLMLMVTMLASLTVFSQRDTQNIITDSIIPLPKLVAVEVVKDIIRKDSLEAELTYCYELVKIHESNSILKDSIIQSQSSIIQEYVRKDENMQNIIMLKDIEIANNEAEKKSLQKENKKIKNRSIGSKIGLSAIILGLGAILILK